ncbi:hypothetical protein R3F64_01460 [Halomonas sp. 5021]|jgi:hypothetical protein|uniref:hypothetical protein n=1 Tax=Halomonas sp. 5021 TaxID=3082156 RepID=UPI002FC5BD81
MGVVTQEVEHDYLDVSLVIDQKAKEETRRPWQIVSLEVGMLHSMTPKELRQLGRWLQQEGKRIGREFKSNGARKEQ